MRWVDNLVATTALLGESGRCVHIGGREADIYELFCAANDAGAHFVIRSAYPRLVKDGTMKTDAKMKEVRVMGYIVSPFAIKTGTLPRPCSN